MVKAQEGQSSDHSALPLTRAHPLEPTSSQGTTGDYIDGILITRRARAFVEPHERRSFELCTHRSNLASDQQLARAAAWTRRLIGGEPSLPHRVAGTAPCGDLLKGADNSCGEPVKQSQTPPLTIKA